MFSPGALPIRTIHVLTPRVKGNVFRLLVTGSRRDGKVCQGARGQRVSGGGNANHHDLRDIRLSLFGEGFTNVSNDHRHLFRKVLRIPLWGHLPSNDNNSAFLRPRLPNVLVPPTAVSKGRAGTTCGPLWCLTRRNYPRRQPYFMFRAL